MDLGICVRNVPANDLADVGRFAEANGFAEVFVPDGARGAMIDGDGKLNGRDAFCGFAAMFSATSVVRGALGVAAVPMHHSLVLPNLASTLQEMSGGRFSLGLGVSHPEQTKRFGIEFPAKQIDYMRTWIRDLRQRSATGMAYGGGWPVLLAALGPRMVQLGAEEADGLVLNWLTPEHAAASVAKVRAAAPEGASPRTVLYLRLMTDEALRQDAIRYDEMANYHRNFVAQGITNTDEIIAGTTLSLSDLGAAKARIEEYRASDLDLLCIYPMSLGPADRRALEELAR